MRGMRVAAAMVAACVAAGTAKAGPTLADYGRLPSLSRVEVSPDGTRLAVLGGDANHREIQICDTQTRKPILVQDIGAVKVRGLMWAGPQHLLIITSIASPTRGVVGEQKSEQYMAADLNLERKSIEPLMKDGAKRSLNTIVGWPVVVNGKGGPVVIVEGVYFPPGGGEQEVGALALYRIDLRSDEAERIQIGEPHTNDFLVGLDGKAVARSEYDGKAGRWALYVRTPGGWKTAHEETAPIDHPYIEGLSADGQSVIVSTLEDERWVTRKVALKDASWPLATDTREEGVLLDSRTRVVFGRTSGDMEHTVYSYTATHDQAVWNAISKAFAGEEVGLESWSDDRRFVVLKVEGAREGAGFALIDTTKGSADWLGDEYDAIGPEVYAERRTITYKAADGFEVPAYLTLPKGRPAKKLPLVVLAHGGPAARDEPGFDWWSQALASRGYAVLQPQYRGSGGFGEAHLKAGYGEFGRKMQTDLSDGVRALAKSGEIDPTRVCIMGASYGGYAALAGAVFDPGAYRCAVDVAGLSDLRRMLADIDKEYDGQARDAERYWDRYMGANSRKDPALDAISPALHADKAAMPILIIHGEDDTVVPYEQSVVMRDALLKAGKPVEFVTLKSEDHWLSRSETRLQMLTAAVAFLEKNNPPDAAPAQTQASAAKPPPGR